MKHEQHTVQKRLRYCDAEVHVSQHFSSEERHGRGVNNDETQERGAGTPVSLSISGHAVVHVALSHHGWAWAWQQF